MAQASACASKRASTILDQLFEDLKSYEKKDNSNFKCRNLEAFSWHKRTPAPFNNFTFQRKKRSDMTS